MRGLPAFLADVWRLARPYFSSEERWSARALLAGVIALDLARVGLSVVLNYWYRAFYNGLEQKDWQAFLDLLLTWRPMPDGSIMPGFAGIAMVAILIAIYRTWLSQWLHIRWRRWMTERLLDRWLVGGAYYRLSLTGAPESAFAASAAQAAGGMKGGADPGGIGSDNPDQRIAEDVRGFTNSTMSLALGLLSNIVTLVSFVAILWGLSGVITVFGVAIAGYMVWMALVYAVFGTVATHLVGYRLAALDFLQERVEANFRYALVRVRENVDGIALHGGAGRERAALGNRFHDLVANWWAIMWRTKKVNAVTAFYGQLAVIFPFVVAAPRYFSGEIPLGALMQTISAFGRVEDAMSWFVNAYRSLADWRATVARLADFERSIRASEAADGGVRRAPAVGADYAARDLSLALPDGQALLSTPELHLRAGESVVVAGRSGSGKSTLFRALAGIWPFGSGEVAPPAGRTMFLPQRPYLPLGTLRHALTYPADPDAYPDAAVREALHAVGLGAFEPRLDAEEPWAQRLSGGEQQRVAIGRALLAAPEWLFLDEATASLDPAGEAELYALLRRRLPGTTIVSIAHRPAVAGFHDRALVLERSADGAARLHPAERPAAAD